MDNVVDTFMSGVAGAGVVLLAGVLIWPFPIRAKVPTLPTELNLAGVQWKVDVVEYPADHEGVLGFTRCDTHHIELKSGINDQRETLLHEILHAYVCGNGLEGFDIANLYYNSASDAKHDGIDNIGYVMKDALERNPQLAAYEVGK